MTVSKRTIIVLVVAAAVAAAVYWFVIRKKVTATMTGRPVAYDELPPVGRTPGTAGSGGDIWKWATGAQAASLELACRKKGGTEAQCRFLREGAQKLTDIQVAAAKKVGGTVVSTAKKLWNKVF